MPLEMGYTIILIPTESKLASHVWFDEGMNDLPMEDTPLNVQHLQRVDNGQPLTKEQNFVSSSHLECYLSVPSQTFFLCSSNLIHIIHIPYLASLSKMMISFKEPL